MNLLVNVIVSGWITKQQMEVICTNDNFPAPVLAFYAEFGVQTPKRDKMYTIRQVKRHTTGETGVLLNEIQNPEVPVKHPVMGEVWFEPTFNINRFATLLGQPVRQEEIENVHAWLYSRFRPNAEIWLLLK